MATTQDQTDKDAAEFAEQFDGPEPTKNEMTEDEAFGLTNPAPGEGATTDTGGADAEPPAGGSEAPAEPAPPAPAPAESDAEKELAAREAALAEKEASIETTNVGETQAGNQDDGAGGNGDGDDLGAEDDPGKLLADDFGPDFVHLLTRFIEKICAAKVGEGIGGVSATVDEVIQHLQAERHASHFKAIAAAHEDFKEVTESPEFGAWLASQSPEDQGRYQRVIDSGSAEEIIDMLSAFKGSRNAGADEGALDDAEGVRSGGMALPSEPPASDDYARAWDLA